MAVPKPPVTNGASTAPTITTDTLAPLPNHFAQPQNMGFTMSTPQQTAQPLPSGRSLLKDDPSDSSDSDSSDSDDDYAPQKNQPSKAAPTPNRTVSASGAITSPGTSLRKIPSNIEPPPWIPRAQRDLLMRYPQDKIQVIPKPKTDASAPQEWRVKCLDW